jgi:hypothetical protein
MLLSDWRAPACVGAPRGPRIDCVARTHNSSARRGRAVGQVETPGGEAIFPQGGHRANEFGPGCRRADALRPHTHTHPARRGEDWRRPVCRFACHIPCIFGGNLREILRTIAVDETGSPDKPLTKRAVGCNNFGNAVIFFRRREGAWTFTPSPFPGEACRRRPTTLLDPHTITDLIFTVPVGPGPPSSGSRSLPRWGATPAGRTNSNNIRLGDIVNQS